MGNISACGGSNCVSWTGTRSPLAVSHYALEVSHDVSATTPPGGWTTVASPVPVDLSGSNRYWHAAGGASNGWYRVRVVPR